MHPVLRLVVALLVLTRLAIADEGDYEFGRAGFGAFLVHVPLERQAELNLVPGQGMLVVGVRPGSTAAAAGLVPGAVVLTINDQSVQSRRDVRSVVRSSQPGDRLVLSTRSVSGQASVLRGTFQERQPWRGPPPGGWAPPPGGVPMSAWWGGGDVVQQQRQQLADEAELYQSLRAELAGIIAARAAALAAEPAWRLRVMVDPVAAVAVPEAAILPAPVTEAEPSPAPAWRLRVSASHSMRQP